MIPAGATTRSSNPSSHPDPNPDPNPNLTLTLTLTPTRCDNPQFFVGLAEPPTSKAKKFYPPTAKPEEAAQAAGLPESPGLCGAVGEGCEEEDSRAVRASKTTAAAR